MLDIFSSKKWYNNVYYYDIYNKEIKVMNTEEFTEKARKIHGDKYNYSNVRYVNNHTKVCIICPIHGEFWQMPKLHLKGSGCPKCAAIKGGDYLRDTKEDFIKKARKIHGDKYDYSKVEYNNSRTPVCIICPIHGEFWQTPTRHLNSRGCVKCAKANKGYSLRSNREEFIEKCKERYGEQYNYEKVEYVNSRTPVCVTCIKHGDFIITPHTLLHSNGCPQCIEEKKENKRNILIQKQEKQKKLKQEIKLEKIIHKKEKFIKQANLIHNNKYDYSKVEYKNNSTKVCIICPIHGEFWQTPHNHLKGCGCKKCTTLKLADKFSYSTLKFIENAQKIHGDKYDYSKVEYKNNRTKVCIICPIHGEFWQTPSMHYNEKQGCPLCGTLSSKDENEIANVLSDKYHLNVEQRVHSLIKPLELDIYLPEFNLGIEYNGLRWHSEKFGKDKNYHINKLKKCNEKGIDLLMIFSDEYINHKNIVLNKITHIIKQDYDKEKIYARKCIIKEINSSEAEKFLSINHIQGFAPSTVYLGCFYDNILIAVMSFKIEKKGENRWELNRFATDISKHCIGIGGKIFSYFIKNYNPEYVKSFADRRWTINVESNLYTKLGFKLDKILPPDYRYFYKKEYGENRVHKFNFRKEILHKKFNLPLSMTEKEMCDKIGAYRIWDCGLYKYVWKK